MTVFEALVDTLQGEFDRVVEQGSDEELFLAGYLNGHYSLAVSQAESARQLDLVGIDHFVLRSLEKAQGQGELSDQDFTAVRALWASMVEKHASGATD